MHIQILWLIKQHFFFFLLYNFYYHYDYYHYYYRRINTFWISTGLFPQEIIVALSTSVLLKTVTLTTMKGNKKNYAIR